MIGHILLKIRKKEWAIFFPAKDQKVNILGFASRPVSAAGTQLCCCSTEASWTICKQISVVMFK